MKLLRRFKNFGVTASHDRNAYRDFQTRIGRYYRDHLVRPYVRSGKVLDIGCAEGGVLLAFAEAGYDCTGLEYSANRVEYAQEQDQGHIRFFQGDIERFVIPEQYDVILLLDVFEHLADKLTALHHIRQMLAPAGIVIISFPPFQSAYGGHQQVMRSWLKFVPWVHLLPESIYLRVLRRVERQNIESHLRNYRTGTTIRQFEHLVKQTDLRIIYKQTYLIRPRQALRFDLKIRVYPLNVGQEYLATGTDYVLAYENNLHQVNR
ncbi:MAG: class I SAM-dependent methyltransferase [candidate division KSB1 bacterium]|nr:class I SAM-dependent methyltransferase [candidate division KSB1 bacterium]MDZ7319541.1 class I SAM-dependent methyltransferase [candidate division KSB1 bacterium]MDZ7339814.1 class I SAM-dependent methyltransferase [candidate division KSB1 bacterium]